MNKPKFPWAGAGALAVAVLITVPLISNGVDLNPWYLSRAAGLVAYVLLWLSLCLGLLQSCGLLRGAASAASNMDLHNFTALGAIYAIVFHAVILLWGHFIPFSPAEILIPFASRFKPFPVGIGGVAFYISLGVTITTYYRTRLSPKAWRTLHLLSLPAFAVALLHSAVLGTDTAVPAVAFMYRFTGISVAALTGYRLFLGVSKRASSAGRG